MDTYTGQRFGDYQLVRFLGRGGFGDVYLGEHVQDKLLAAIKVLKTDLKDRTLTDVVNKFKEFINEASSFNLKHPHIVPLLAFGLGKDDTPFLVFDYAPNGSLLRRHPRGTSLPLTVIVSYVKPIAAALQYAHDRRRIHRDVKPENILLGANNEVLLSDFGIATFAHSTQSWEEQRMSGTLAYMAPEQIQRKAQPASDQYALGIMVYEWLCGHPPFQGDGVSPRDIQQIQVMYQHLGVPPPPLSNRVTAISPEVEQVVMKALAKGPEQRFRNVQEFAQALEACLNPPVGTTLLTYHGHSRKEWTETVHGTLAHVHGDDRTVSTVAWSPDGQYVASGEESYHKYTVQVWNARNGRLQRTFHVHSLGGNGVQSVAWSPDSSKILYFFSNDYLHGYEGDDGSTSVSTSTYSEVRLWDVSTGNTLFQKYYIKHNTRWEDGQHYDIYTGEVVLQILWVSSSPRIVYGYTGEYDVWAIGRVHLANITSKLFMYPSMDKGIGYVANKAALSSNGKYIAMSLPTRVEIVDIVEGKHISTYKDHAKPVNILTWSPDGNYIVSGSSDTIVHIWEVRTGTNVYTYRGHSSTVNALAWSPDGNYIASGSNDKTVQVWDAITGNKCVTYIGNTDNVLSVAWSPDSKRIASASRGMVQVWQAM